MSNEQNEEEFVEDYIEGPERLFDFNDYIPESERLSFTDFYPKRLGPIVSNEQLAGSDAKAPPTIDDMFYADFARDVYNSKNNRNDIKDFKYQLQDSTDQVGVYTNQNDVIFGIKGTDGNNIMENMLSNIAIAQGGSSVNPLFASAGLVASGINPASALTAGSLSLLAFGNYQNNLTSLENQLQKVRVKYPKKKIKISGHSKGGSFANVLGISNKDVDVFTFNAGRGLPNLYNKVKCYFGDCSNIKNFRITGDFASALPTSFQEGKEIELKPKIPDARTQLESKSLESIFIPADLYIPHSVRNFNDRKPENLMPDYGLFGRTLARRVGSGIGAVVPLVLPKVLDKTADLIGKSTLKIPGVYNTVKETVKQTSRRSANTRLISENLSLGFMTSPSRSQTLAGATGESIAEQLGETVLKTAKKELNKKIKSSMTRNMKGASKYLSKSMGSVNSGIATGIASGGIGDVFGAMIYDPYIKSSEFDLGDF